MIRMIQSQSVGHAKAYFIDALSKSDYYVSDQELPGFWEGRLAARLGLNGSTNKDDFYSLCDNRNPLDGDHLTPRTKDERTTGYDINFHCPKSVSILNALSTDDHIIRAFRDSVTETMKAIEADAATRVRRGGAYADRLTGELVWGHFVHQTARPVEGFVPDPHLHSHCFVFNATWDEQEQRFKAGQFRDIKRDMPFYQAQFHKTLSDKLIDLGYDIRATDKSFEIVGVPQKVISAFSKRTDEIGRLAAKLGITDEKELSQLGARTRAKKQKGLSMDELKKEWRSQIVGIETDIKEGESWVRHAPKKPELQLSSQQCLDHAVLHCFERASVLEDRKLLAEAVRHSIGSKDANAAAISKQFKSDPRIIHVEEYGRMLCTTKDVLAEEKHMVELAKQGKSAMKPLYEMTPVLNLKDQQAAAVQHILTTTDRISIIRGAAGAGKTTLMREAIQKMEEAGKEVTVIAPTSQASRGVLREEGFAKATTVAQFLQDQNMQTQIKNKVLWVDEAGLLGTKDMKALLEVTKEQNARLILGGDTRQHASVVRGDALRILNTVGGIQSAEVSKIYRQQDEGYRNAVEHLSKGEIGKGFEKLDKMGFVVQTDPTKINQILVDDFIETMKRGKSVLVISPTHNQGEAITEAIRNRMRDEGMIGKKEYFAERLINQNLTEAEKKDHRNFEDGQIVQFNQNAEGIKRGSQWTVEKKNENLFLKNDAGETRVLPIELSDRYDLFESSAIALSKGDLVRITRNGFDSTNKRMNNGDILAVENVSKTGDIILKNKISHQTYAVSKDFGHVAHAHCITSHASQGKTVGEVFIYQSAATFAATDAKQFYVSVSRGKDRARIYTDDKDELLHHASKMGDRQSAIEIVNRQKESKQFANEFLRNHVKSEAMKDIAAVAEQKEKEEYEPDIEI